MSYTPIPERLGQLVKDAREARNWSRTRLGEATGMSPDRVKGIETQIVDPRWTEVIQLALTLGLGLDRMLYTHPSIEIEHEWRAGGWTQKNIPGV